MLWCGLCRPRRQQAHELVPHKRRRPAASESREKRHSRVSEMLLMVQARILHSHRTHAHTRRCTGKHCHLPGVVLGEAFFTELSSGLAALGAHLIVRAEGDAGFNAAVTMVS